MAQHNNTPIYSGSKVVGEVRGSVFYKPIIGSKHLLKKPPAIAISVDALEQAEQAGAVSVRVFDKESKIVYETTLEHFRAKAFPLNRGFGNQLALPLDGWIRSCHTGRLQLSLLEACPS